MNISNCLYQCYCLSLPLTIRDYFIFPQKCMNVLYLSGADLGGGGSGGSMEPPKLKQLTSKICKI